MSATRENFTQAIEFSKPAYLPCTLEVNLDWLQDKDERKRARIRELQGQFKDDLFPDLDAEIRENPEPVNGVARWIDEWGTGWVDNGHGAKTESYPLIDGYGSAPERLVPDPARPGRFDRADRLLQNRAGRYARACVWFTLFERLWMLRGFENMLMDPYLEEESFCRLRDQIVAYNLTIIDHWLERKVDGVFFSDDWGCQKGLLMNPHDWRRFYRPSYKRMFDRVHAGGAHVWMHLCGNITAILPDLVEIGVNVLNPVQPQAMNLDELARDFGGRLCFNGGIDVQGTLIRGSPADVRREVHRLVDLFGRFDGGYIGATSHSPMPETPLDNIIALYEAFLEVHNPA